MYFWIFESNLVWFDLLTIVIQFSWEAEKVQGYCFWCLCIFHIRLNIEPKNRFLFTCNFSQRKLMAFASLFVSVWYIIIYGLQLKKCYKEMLYIQQNKNLIRLHFMRTSSPCDLSIKFNIEGTIFCSCLWIMP